MKRKQEEVHVDEPIFENPYAHLHGKGRLVNEIQNYLDVEKSLKRAAMEIIKTDANVLHKVLPNYKNGNNLNEAILQAKIDMFQKPNIDKTEIKSKQVQAVKRENGIKNGSIKNSSLKLQFW